MTAEERIQALEESVTWLESMLGVQFLGKSSAELRASLNPSSALPGGRYPYMLDSYQLHAAFDALLGPGGTIETLLARIAALEARPTANVVTPSGDGTLSGVTPVNGSGGDVGFQLNTGTVVHRLYGNPQDYGLRLWFNYREPYVNGSSSSVPSLMQMYLFFEQDGAISVGYFKPVNTPAGPYDDLGGKGIVFRPGGRNPDGSRGKHSMIFSGQVGRGLQLGVCRTNPNYPDRFDFEIDPDGGDNPISFTVEGQPRRVRMRADGTLYAE